MVGVISVFRARPTVWGWRSRLQQLPVLAALLMTGVQAQAPPAAEPAGIDGAERRMLKSKTNGAEYRIDVALPIGYGNSQKRYPVLYALDGNTMFPVVAGSYRALAGIGIMPAELIMVGIGYRLSDWSNESNRERQAMRTRDLTTPRALGTAGSSPGPGRAPEFLRFIREELIPFIDSTYRSIPADRGLLGHSYGGLFAAYVLTHAPALFQRYSIGSPSLWFDNEAGLRWEAEYAAGHSALPARVYAYVGGAEDEDSMQAPSRRFWRAIQSRHYPEFELIDFATVPDELHSPVMLISIQRALRALYAPRAVSVPPDVLAKYAGAWRAEDNVLWKVSVDRDRLVLEITDHEADGVHWSARIRRLYGTSQTNFYSDMGDVTMVFSVDPVTKLPTKMEAIVAGDRHTLRIEQ